MSLLLQPLRIGHLQLVETFVKYIVDNTQFLDLVQVAAVGIIVLGRPKSDVGGSDHQGVAVAGT